MRKPKPPPVAALLSSHTHKDEDNDEMEGSSSATTNRAVEVVSNLLEGIAVGLGGAEQHDDTSSLKSGSSMKHRKHSTHSSYDKRLPKMNYNNDDDHDGDEATSSAIPYRGFGNNNDNNSSAITTEEAAASASSSSSVPTRRRRYFGTMIRNLFTPQGTDMQLLLTKLDTQFSKLDMLMEVEHQKDVYDGSGIKDRDDPTHPLNNAELISEIHYVGRSADDVSIIELSNFLTNRDSFGCITELWLNNNLISDDGAASIASFLQLPSCALVELWLGENQIGPVGCAEIAASLSTNEYTKLKCLGLYKNPIENGGANCLAQMLRNNHTLSTVDVHGCLYDGKKSSTVVESYGCRVVTASDGTEYVASVVASNPEEKVGYATDARLFDAIKTFAAFNRINPTREQAIRGLSSSNANGQGAFVGSDLNGSTRNERQHHTIVSTFLTDLCNQPPNEKLTDGEKRKWKECEWERLYVEIERARAAARVMADRLQIKALDNISEENFFDDEGDDDGTSQGRTSDGPDEIEVERMGRDLDNEVVRTESKSLRDLKIGIAGCASPYRGSVNGVKQKVGQPLETVSDEAELKSGDEAGKQGMSDASLRLMEMIDFLEDAQKNGEANKDDCADVETAVDGEAEDLAKLEVDTSARPPSRVSSIGSVNDDNEPDEEPPIRTYQKTESQDKYESAVASTKATLSSAMDFLKELDSNADS